MSRIVSRIDTASAAFQRNRLEMTQRVEALHAALHRARYERPQRDIDRLRRQHKLTVRERLDLLLDPGTPFLELSALAANRAYEGEVHGAGQVSMNRGVERGCLHGAARVVSGSHRRGVWRGR